jgi:DnaJ-class molecular chaperone
MPEVTYCDCGRKCIQCPKCEGKGGWYDSGFFSSSWVKCDHCNGVGYLCPEHGHHIRW